MKLTMLKQYTQIKEYLDSVQEYADKNKKALGFLPKCVYSQAAAGGRLWVSINHKGDYLGHLLFGGRLPSLKVFQIFVLKDHRRQNIGKYMLSELEKYGEDYYYYSIEARVAAELTANTFWEKQGYRIIRQINDLEQSKRTINIRVKPLKTQTLFGPADELSIQKVLTMDTLKYTNRPLINTLTYVLDLNVIFDIIKKRPGSKIAGQLIKIGFAGPLRLYLTAEAARELARTTYNEKKDPVLQFVKALPSLPLVPDSELSILLDYLCTIIFPGSDLKDLSLNSQSDLIHIASCIHHGVRGFVTSEKKLLKSNDKIREHYKLDIISPHDLVPSPIYPSRSLYERQTLIKENPLIVKEIAEHDRHKIESFLYSIGISQKTLFDSLLPDSGGRPRTRLAVHYNNEIIAFASWDHILSRRLTFYLFVDESFPAFTRIIDHILETLTLNLPFRKVVMIDMVTGLHHDFTKETALARGFRETSYFNSDETMNLCKVSYRGPLGPQDWHKFTTDFHELTGFTLPLHMPTTEQFENTGILLKLKDNMIATIKLFDFETLLSPVIVISSKRDSILVPIRPDYSEDLLCNISKQLSFLPQQEVSFHLEKAYFRSYRGSKIFKRGGLILFYESRFKGGKQALIGSARVTYTDIIAVDKAIMELSRQGVLAEKKLHDIANKNKSKKLHAFTFDNFIEFSNMITLETLRAKIIGRHPLISPFQLNPKSTNTIFKLGYRITI